MLIQNQLFYPPYLKYFISLIMAALVFNTNTTFAQKKETVDQMPYLISKDCSGNHPSELKACSDKLLLNYIYHKIKYPELAKKKNTEGTVIISFIITPKGKVDNIKILKDIGAGCGKEAVRVVRLMNEENMKWVPGKKNGKAIASQYNLPIRFTLKDESTKNTKKKVHTIVDEMPYMISIDCGQGVRFLEHKCGSQAFRDFITSNIKYPPEAKKNKTEGVVVISFIVNVDGTIEDVTILRDILNGCGEEAIRVIKLMSQQHVWAPGILAGNPVPVKINYPISFKL